MKRYRAWESPELVSFWILITFGGLQITPCSIISPQNSLQCVVIIIMVYYRQNTGKSRWGMWSMEGSPGEFYTKPFAVCHLLGSCGWCMFLPAASSNEENSPKPWYPGFLLRLSNIKLIPPVWLAFLSIPSQCQGDTHGSKPCSHISLLPYTIENSPRKQKQSYWAGLPTDLERWQ